jgi:hypothetical protein
MSTLDRMLPGIISSRTNSAAGAMKGSAKAGKTPGSPDPRSPKANRGKGQRYKPGYKPGTPLGGM